MSKLFLPTKKSEPRESDNWKEQFLWMFSPDGKKTRISVYDYKKLKLKKIKKIKFKRKQ